MKVKDIMIRTPARCTSRTNLGGAVEILWNRNCGILPIVNEEEKVIGVVTDRDLCIALGTRNRLPGEITAGEVMSGKLFACRASDPIRIALETMAHAQVRRLPVIDDEGKLEGVLSMDDVVLHSETRSAGKTSELSHEDVVEALKRVYQPELPQIVRQNSAAA
jgi:CBS domain-containing protein